MREYAESILIALVLALLIRTFVVQPFKIPTGSMRPTLMEGDRILVNKYLYRFKDPQRGDIIVFKYPGEEKKDYIKRLVALPGETVGIEEGRVKIGDKIMTEPEILTHFHYYNRGSFGHVGKSVDVPQDAYFVLGDNSGSSEDSRFWGYVPQKNLVGRAFMIFWPPQRVRLLK
ncbi:MAG: signal peptidase I [Candidatus Omnitrophica bacterium]|nr:signal peptidase I [Candidatus Omnitrophota bacterium]